MAQIGSTLTAIAGGVISAIFRLVSPGRFHSVSSPKTG
jgi:hypothetical protein